MNTVRFKLTAYTDPAGKWNESAPKKGNEDDLFVDADLANGFQGEFMSDEVVDLSEAGCLMVIADGMGGMNAGEVASSIAIDTVKSLFAPHNLSPDVMESSRSRVKFMEKAVADADAAIKGRARIDRECEGMGSTIVIAWLYADELSVTWCGDSRAYIYRETEGIRQVSKDHSYVQSLVDEGALTEAAAFDHPYGNIITRSLGDPDKKAVPDSVTVPVYKGDIILLCSDGLNGVLRDRKTYDESGNLYPGENIEDIIRNNRGTLTGCRESLWLAAEQAGWYDNVTAVLCEIVDGNDVVLSASDPRTSQEQSAGTTAGTKSFIKIRKKTLKWVAVVCAVVLCVICAIVAAPKLKLRKNSEFKDRWTALYDESKQNGYTAVIRKLTAVEDSTDMTSLDRIAEDLKLRYALMDSLGKLVDKTEYPDEYSRYQDSIKVLDAVSELRLPDRRTEVKDEKGVPAEKAVTEDKEVKERGVMKELEEFKEAVETPEDKPLLTPVQQEDKFPSEIKFMRFSHVAEPGVGLDSITRIYCNSVYQCLALLEMKSYAPVESADIQKDKEYHVVVFSTDDFDALCGAIKACEGKLSGGLFPAGFDSNEFYKDGNINWNCLPEEEEFTVSLK